MRDSTPPRDTDQSVPLLAAGGSPHSDTPTPTLPDTLESLPTSVHVETASALLNISNKKERKEKAEAIGKLLLAMAFIQRWPEKAESVYAHKTPPLFLNGKVFNAIMQQSDRAARIAVIDNITTMLSNDIDSIIGLNLTDLNDGVVGAIDDLVQGKIADTLTYYKLHPLKAAYRACPSGINSHLLAFLVEAKVSNDQTTRILAAIDDSCDTKESQTVALRAIYRQTIQSNVEQAHLHDSDYNKAMVHLARCCQQRGIDVSTVTESEAALTAKIIQATINYCIERPDRARRDFEKGDIPPHLNQAVFTYMIEDNIRLAPDSLTVVDDPRTTTESAIADLKAHQYKVILTTIDGVFFGDDFDEQKHDKEAYNALTQAGTDYDFKSLKHEIEDLKNSTYSHFKKQGLFIIEECTTNSPLSALSFVIENPNSSIARNKMGLPPKHANPFLFTFFSGLAADGVFNNANANLLLNQIKAPALHDDGMCSIQSKKKLIAALYTFGCRAYSTPDSTKADSTKPLSVEPHLDALRQYARDEGIELRHSYNLGKDGNWVDDDADKAFDNRQENPFSSIKKQIEGFIKAEKDYRDRKAAYKATYGRYMYYWPSLQLPKADNLHIDALLHEFYLMKFPEGATMALSLWESVENNPAHSSISDKEKLRIYIKELWDFIEHSRKSFALTLPQVKSLKTILNRYLRERGYTMRIMHKEPGLKTDNGASNYIWVTNHAAHHPGNERRKNKERKLKPHMKKAGVNISRIVGLGEGMVAGVFGAGLVAILFPALGAVAVSLISLGVIGVGGAAVNYFLFKGAAEATLKDFILGKLYYDNNGRRISAGKQRAMNMTVLSCLAAGASFGFLSFSSASAGLATVAGLTSIALPPVGLAIAAAAIATVSAAALSMLFYRIIGGLIKNDALVRSKSAEQFFFPRDIAYQTKNMNSAGHGLFMLGVGLRYIASPVYMLSSVLATIARFTYRETIGYAIQSYHDCMAENGRKVGWALLKTAARTIFIKLPVTLILVATCTAALIASCGLFFHTATKVIGKLAHLSNIVSNKVGAGVTVIATPINATFQVASVNSFFRLRKNNARSIGRSIASGARFFAKKIYMFYQKHWNGDKGKKIVEDLERQDKLRSMTVKETLGKMRGMIQEHEVETGSNTIRSDAERTVTITQAALSTGLVVNMLGQASAAALPSHGHPSEGVTLLDDTTQAVTGGHSSPSGSETAAFIGFSVQSEGANEDAIIEETTLPSAASRMTEEGISANLCAYERARRQHHHVKVKEGDDERATAPPMGFTLWKKPTDAARHPDPSRTPSTADSISTDEGDAEYKDKTDKTKLTKGR